MKENWTRRAMLKRGVVAGAVMPAAMMLVSSHALAADPVPLDPNDPTAKALGYVSTAPNPAQKCANCAQFQGASSDARGGCTIFPGKTVAAVAWCSAWAKKAGT